MKKFLIPVALLGLVVGAASCKKTSDCTLIVHVVKDSVDFITGDTSEVDVHHATVEVYNEATGHDETLDQTLETGSNGQAEFVYKSEAIFLVRVTHSGQVIDAGYAVLKPGETVTKDVNLDDY